MYTGDLRKMAKPTPTADQKRIDKLEEYVGKLIKTNSQLMNTVEKLTREHKRLTSRVSQQDASIKKLINTLHK